MVHKAIRVQGLGKEYQIGQRERGYTTFREAVSRAVTAPFRRLRELSGSSEPEGSFWALKDVSFDVEPGEVVGIIGRNGAGKSTLLKILSQITEPTTGEITLNGRVASLLEVGTGFHPELTGRENIYLNGSILGMRRAEIKRKFDEIVAFAEVEKFLDTPVKRYSSGMYVRLAFAVAAHLEPEILIIDEVLAVGDAAFQKKCLGKMDEVARDGRTVLIVSHNAEMIASLCTSCALLQKGQIVFRGPTADAISTQLRDAICDVSGQYNLSNHTYRNPSHKSLIKQVDLINSDGKITSQFISMRPLLVNIHLNLVNAIRNPRLAIAVEDYLGRRIFTAANYFSQSWQSDMEIGLHTMCCKIPELKLGTGRYLLSISIATRESGLLDSLDGSIWFDVEAHNCYGTGEPYMAVYGPVLEKSLWMAV